MRYSDYLLKVLQSGVPASAGSGVPVSRRLPRQASTGESRDSRMRYSDYLLKVLQAVVLPETRLKAALREKLLLIDKPI